MSWEDAMPYCWVERRIREREGTVEYFDWVGNNRIKTSPWYWMPHALVKRWIAAKKRHNLNKRRSASLQRPIAPHSGFDRDVATEVARIRAERDDARAVRPDVRVLVCLHLFYPDIWPVVRAYLENLSPYRWDLLLTYPGGLVSEGALAAVRAFRPDAKLVACPNAGFDIGPFVESLNCVDLDDYDVVFKLQTKGSNRPWIFVYDQIFRRSDWFLNLYEGVLNGRSCHGVIAALAEGSCAMAAAENLIVRDPRHKQNFVRRFCEGRGLAYVEDYRYVAGTCFAARPEVLKPLKALGLGLADFEDTVRGRFSLAHSLERWMCFAAAGRFLGVPVRRATYDEDVRYCKSVSALRLLDDSRFELDDEYVYRALEFARVGRYEVAEVRLGDIRRVWFDLRAYRLDECSPYKYLTGDKDAYERYCRENSKRSRFQMSRERFDALRQSMAEFDGRHLPVVFGNGNIIVDGQHRCCILLHRFGPEHRIKVVRLFAADNEWRPAGI